MALSTVVDKLEYTFKNDVLFKMIFVQHQDLLQKLIAVLIGIEYTSIEKFEVRNSEIPPENLGDKFCRLDINMLVDGQVIDLEIQINDEGDYPERTLYHWAREYSSALKSGGDYADLPRTIIVSIVAFKLFLCKEYHSEFRPLEVSRGDLLSDRMSLHYFELPKIPRVMEGNS